MAFSGYSRGREMRGIRIVTVLWMLAIAHHAWALSVFSSCNFVRAELNFPAPERPPSAFLEGPRGSPFVQHSSKFWAFDRASNSWRLTDVSCLFSNGSWWRSCNGREDRAAPPPPPTTSAFTSEITSQAVPQQLERSVPPRPEAQGTDRKEQEQDGTQFSNRWDGMRKPKSAEPNSGASPPPVQSRASMARASDVSLWVTGQSGAIYERFWNGVQWVVIPHDLPAFSGRAAAVMSVNRTTLIAMSETGLLYQLQMDENGQLMGPWLSTPSYDSSASTIGASSNNVSLRRFGLVSADESALYFATTDGSLAQLSLQYPIKWVNHHRPRGGDIAAVADAGILRSGVVFTISKSGDLYEYDSKAKPPWKKHVREGSAVAKLLLAPASGVAVRGLAGAASVSLFLLTRDGSLVERRFHQSKWRWIVHPVPDEEDPLSPSLGPFFTDPDLNAAKSSFSLFLTSEYGVLWEYKLENRKGFGRTFSESGVWVDHGHPFQTPIISSVPGAALSHGRLFFALVDGRLGELHAPGLGGGNLGPVPSTASVRDRKQQGLYTWSILESPETEGGNAEYCTSVMGPGHCLKGTKDGQSGWQAPAHGTEFSQRKRLSSKGRAWRRGNLGMRSDLPAKEVETSTTTDLPSPSRASPWNQTLDSLFRLRTMQTNKSIFFIGRDGTAFERFFSGEAWLWLKHEHNLALRGIVGMYSGGVFVMDEERNLLLRERIGNVLHWLNCTEMTGGRKVVSGPPWDHGLLGEAHVATVEDALFLVGQDGNLIEFLVALRQFVWGDCGHPPNTQVAVIVDQETLRYRVVFVVGTDGRLYHFNRVTRQWISHQQPNNVLLSPVTGTVIRPDIQSTKGSLFLRTEDGGLMEFHWDVIEGWKWTDHGFPGPGVTLATSPGPSIGGKRLFVVGSDGKLYSRFWDETQWAWCGHGRPSPEAVLRAERNIRGVYNPDHTKSDQVEHTEDNRIFNSMKFGGVIDIYVSFNGECTLTVAPVRPIALSPTVVMVVMHDGRVASIKSEEGSWNWASVHDTPSSSCQSSYWAATGPQI